MHWISPGGAVIVGSDVGSSGPGVVGSCVGSSGSDVVGVAVGLSVAGLDVVTVGLGEGTGVARVARGWARVWSALPCASCRCLPTAWWGRRPPGC
ncbi:hypothetical protein ACFQQB_08650 [Nonomuraea rubra]|uniref:hypothetical protein n=1 Tax=Nonomuraea rubra TaxID=46180 RepID=UPI0036098CE9